MQPSQPRRRPAPRIRLPRRAAVLFALALPAGAPAQDALPPLSAACAGAVAEFQRQHDVPGLSVAVASGDHLAAQGFGHADLENLVPATAETVYRLASISKPVTAVAALRLAEDGRLDLDADVRSYVPAFPEKRWPVTTRQLLGHLGGVRHYRRGERECTDHFDTQRQGLLRFAADELLHEPGTRYRYSTYGYNLAAAAIEAARGQPFPACVREIAAQAGAATLQDDDVRRLVRHRAQGYVREDGELRNSRLMDGSYKLGGGGLCSNAPDLARFGTALLDGRLLRPESFAAMTTVQRTAGGEATGYGLGLRVSGSEEAPEFGHGGAQSRVSTALLLRPRTASRPRVVVVVLCNLEGLRPLPLARRLADLAVQN